MSEGLVNYRDLLEFVENLVQGNVEPRAPELLQRLQPYKRVFLNLLQHKGPSPDSREQVAGGKPTIPSGHVSLGPNDVQDILLLSDELRMDELLALQCLLTAHLERGEAAAEVAAGIFFDERRAVLSSLHLLLQMQAIGREEGAPAEVLDAVCAFNISLLDEVQNGRRVLVSRLISCIQDDTLEPGPGSKLVKVVDESGCEVDRRSLVLAERSLLCECLVYCCWIERRQAAADIRAMMDLLASLSSAARSKPPASGGEAGQQLALQQAYTVLLSIICTLLPQASISDDRVDAGLTSLATDAELAAYFADEAAGLDGFQACLRLTWAVLLSNQGPPTSRERCALCVKQATDAGVLTWMREGLVGSHAFQDDLPFQRELYAQILGQLLLDFLYSEIGRDEMGRLMLRSSQRADSSQPPDLAADDLASLLLALAAVFSTYPDMWLNEDLRDPVLGHLMEYIARSTLLSEVPQVFVAYVEVLCALASGPKGAQIMFEQLRPGNTYAIISWNSMFHVMKQYCLRFLPERDGLGRPVQQQRPEQLLVPSEDVQAMCAYLRLFTKIFNEGAPAEVVAWRHTLEEETGVGNPLWEVLFQLMAHPVPQELKAALDGAIGAFAQSPETAVQLLERLLQAVVVTPVAPPVSVLPRYDLAYQLNEIEARKEVYDETLAFVRMLNKLYKAAGPGLPDDGRPYLHFTMFVRSDALGVLHHRAFKSVKQKWEIAAACFEHLQLALQTLKRPLPALPATPDVHVSSTPGLLVMTDLLGERAGLRAVLSVVLAGVEAALQERREQPWGLAREDALLAALRLIRTAFSYDLDVVEALRKTVHTGQYEPLHVVLRADARGIPALMQYVAYVDNPALQAEAIRISSCLASRLPSLPALLLQAPSPGQPAPYVQVSAAFSVCLWDSLFGSAAFVPLLDDEEEWWEGEPEGEDVRATLILQLLHQCVDNPAPNLTHVLLGFNVLEGPQGVAGSLLEAGAPGTCLAGIMKAAHLEQLAGTKPQLYELVLGLLHALAAAPITMEAVLSLLRSDNLLLSQLDHVACSPLPSEGMKRAAHLYQKASLLQLAALQLLRLDPALPLHREYCLSLLSTLFLPVQDTLLAPDLEVEEGQGGARIGEILTTLVYPLTEPQLTQEAGPDLRRTQQRMGLDVLLASPVPVGEGGIRTLSPHGVSCYDIPALAKILRQRCAGQEQDTRRYPGGPAAAANQELRQACQSVLRFAIKYNAVAQKAGAQLDALRGWQAVCEIAIALRYDLLEAAARGAEAGAAGILQDLLERVLEALLTALPAAAPRLAPSLSQVVRTLMMRLQEQAGNQLGLPLGPSSSLRVPTRCHEALLKLVTALREGRSSEAVRLPLYGALLHYLQLCRPPPLAPVPPFVLEALLQGMGVGVEEGSAQLSQLEAELEAGNAAVLSSYPHLTDMLANDALNPSSGKVGRTLALSVLSVLLGGKSGPDVAEALDRGGVGSCLLQELVDTAHHSLLQAGGRARAALTLQEAQLGLLLRMVGAGFRGQADIPSSRLSAITTISSLARCQAMDLEPEEPGAQSEAQGKLRAHLARFHAAVLRIVIAILAGQPSSSAVRAAAAEFVSRHNRTFLRILREAATPPSPRWEPGDVEWKLASLAVDLMRRCLSGENLQSPVFAPLHDAVLGLVRRQASVGRREDNGMDVELLPAPADAAPFPEDDVDASTSLPLLELKAALALYLCQGVCNNWREEALVVESRPPGPGMPWKPSLLTLRDLLVQAADQLCSLHEAERRLLSSLRTPSTSLSLAKAENGRLPLPQGGGLARRAGQVAREEEMALVLTECCLIILSFSLKKAATSSSKSSDLAALRRPLLPVLDQLESLQAPSFMRTLSSGDALSLEVLVRRVKDALAF